VVLLAPETRPARPPRPDGPLPAMPERLSEPVMAAPLRETEAAPKLNAG
jgi:hypothetical protein